MLACSPFFGEARTNRRIIAMQNVKCWIVSLAVVLFIVFAAGCGVDYKQEKAYYPTAAGTEVAADPSPDASSAAFVQPESELCLVVPEGENGRLYLYSSADSRCEQASAVRSFMIGREDPMTILLSAAAGIDYCIGVSRRSGYITISHPRGTVTRSGDEFNWCVTQQAEISDRMIIRSFTAESGIELFVP